MTTPPPSLEPTDVVLAEWLRGWAFKNVAAGTTALSLLCEIAERLEAMRRAPSAEGRTFDLIEMIGWCEARAHFADRGTPFANGQKSGFAATADYLREKLKDADKAVAALRGEP